MIAFNTYWTPAYVIMLMFVFWTLFKVCKVYYMHTCQYGYTSGVLALVWAAMGTYFFHCIW